MTKYLARLTDRAGVSVARLEIDNLRLHLGAGFSVRAGAEMWLDTRCAEIAVYAYQPGRYTISVERSEKPFPHTEGSETLASKEIHIDPFDARRNDPTPHIPWPEQMPDRMGQPVFGAECPAGCGHTVAASGPPTETQMWSQIRTWDKGQIGVSEDISENSAYVEMIRSRLKTHLSMFCSPRLHSSAVSWAEQFDSASGGACVGRLDSTGNCPYCRTDHRNSHPVSVFA